MEPLNKTINCLDCYIGSFEESLSAKNYKPVTLENYRHNLRRLGRLMEIEGIAPSDLTAELAFELGLRLPMAPKAQIKLPNLARRFFQYLIEIGVAERPPLTAAEAERHELLGNLEIYLLRQRGLSPRSSWLIASEMVISISAHWSPATSLRSWSMLSRARHLTATRRYPRICVASSSICSPKDSPPQTSHSAYRGYTSRGARDFRAICRPMKWRPFWHRSRPIRGGAPATMQCCS